jgi:two-component system, OmpR family, sensor histidine kinase KdpD
VLSCRWLLKSSSREYNRPEAKANKVLEASAHKGRPTQSSSFWLITAPCAWTVVSIAIITAAGKAFQPGLDLVTIALVYLLPVLVSAVRWGLWPSLAASFLGILAFDFFFVPPVLSITVSDVRYLLSFAIFLVVALVTGTLAAKLRDQARAASHRERRMAALYSLSHRIAAETDLQGVLRTIVETVAQSLKGPVAIFMPVAPDDTLELVAHSDEGEFPVSEKERAMITWVFELRRDAQSGSASGSSFDRLFVPVSDGERTVAVLAVPSTAGRALSREQREDLDALTGLIALAITRMQLSREAEQARWLAESEKLHSALLNAVSHDLRTPLSSITGAVTGLLADEERYDQEAKRNLLLTIKAGALRMNRFITNLLDTARLESGILKPNRAWCDVNDIIGVTLNEIGEWLPEDRVVVSVPDDLPPVLVDLGLVEQVLMNLLENSIKYSPADAAISIRASRVEDFVRVAVEDAGAPIPEADREHVFDKFYRLRSSKHVSGSGLGLSICKGIIEAQGGSIWVEPSESGGNRFVFTLPLATGIAKKIVAEETYS